jgi:hypothetical protein
MMFRGYTRWAKSRYTVYSTYTPSKSSFFVLYLSYLPSFTIPVKKIIITVYLLWAHSVCFSKCLLFAFICTIHIIPEISVTNNNLVNNAWIACSDVGAYYTFCVTVNAVFNILVIFGGSMSVCFLKSENFELWTQIWKETSNSNM